MNDLEVLARIILRQPAVLLTLFVVAAALAGLTIGLARRLGWPWSRQIFAVLAAAAFALLPATTLARSGPSLVSQLHCNTSVGLLSRSPEAVLNTAVLGPFAFFAVLAARRAAVVLALAAGAAVLVEVIQAATGAGTCEASDVARNVFGAGVGAVAALGLLAIRRGWLDRSLAVERPERVSP